jgi:four helix bundle protein
VKSKGEEGTKRRDLPERTFEFVRRVVRLCQVLDQTPGVSRTLADQLLRSGTSNGANVEEGQASQSCADFVAKYCIACKEARETHYWLRLLAAGRIRGSPPSKYAHAPLTADFNSPIVSQVNSHLFGAKF